VTTAIKKGMIEEILRPDGKLAAALT
jgi:hypothetical protein